MTRPKGSGPSKRAIPRTETNERSKRTLLARALGGASPKDSPTRSASVRMTHSTQADETSAKKKPATKKKPAAKTSTSKKSAAKKPAAKKTAKKGKSTAAASKKKPRAKRRGKKPPPPPPMAERATAWLRSEVIAWGIGLLLGGTAAAAVLYADARADVEAWLAHPPSTTTTTIFSAPPLVRVGEPYPAQELVQDLLAAGYERGSGARRPDSFAVQGDTVHIKRARHDGPGWVIPEGDVRITVVDGHVSATTPSEGVSLLPIPLATVGDLESRRDPVTLDTVAPCMVPALLSIEDARFHHHVGIDPIGLTRALVHTVLYGDLQGGSTLTQQLAKNLFLGPERTVRRKVREVFLAAALESTLDKNALLELYLSEVYLGHHGGMPLYGVEQASRAWFGKAASHLSPGECATLAGVIASPNVYSPLKGHEHALARRDQVIHRMVQVRALTEDQAAAAREEPLATLGAGPSASWKAPWVVDEALEQTTAELGARASERGIEVHTHVQLHLQRAARRAVSEGLVALSKDHDEATGAEAALVAVRARDGAILALVGGRDFVRSPFHRAVDARRQAGSTVKPLTALAAFDMAGMGPATILQDAPIRRDHGGKTWAPTNYDHTFRGPTSVRTTIEDSRNVPAVLLSEAVGPGRQQRTFIDAGLTGATDLPSAALGAFSTTPLELAGAYTVFPAGGKVRQPQLIRVIVDADGTELHRPAPVSTTLARPVATALTRHVMQGVMTDGTARSAKLGGAFGGKTGTTDGGRDAWFVGYDPQVSVSVWVGQDRGVLGLGGAEAALPLWARFMRDIGAPRGRFTDPAGLEQAKVCTTTGAPPCPRCPETRTEWFARGTVPQRSCDKPAPAAEPEEAGTD